MWVARRETKSKSVGCLGEWKECVLQVCSPSRVRGRFKSTNEALEGEVSLVYKDASGTRCEWERDVTRLDETAEPGRRDVRTAVGTVCIGRIIMDALIVVSCILCHNRS
jgi:hypothetical protein